LYLLNKHRHYGIRGLFLSKKIGRFPPTTFQQPVCFWLPVHSQVGFGAAGNLTVAIAWNKVLQIPFLIVMAASV
jgi:hypothetical protein